MFDVAWSEMAVILVVALVVISPEDVPKILKAAKGWMQKLQAVKEEFRTVANGIINEAEIQQAKEELKAEVAEVNSKIRQIVDLEGNLRDAYDISDIRPDIKG